MGSSPLFCAQIDDLATLCPVVAVTGEIDCATAPQLAEVLIFVLAGDPLDIVLDLSDTTFIDCSGISVILSTKKAMAAESRLILRHPQPRVRKLLELLEIDRACCVLEGAS
jgi:anti-sigma B factor antagonist